MLCLLSVTLSNHALHAQDSAKLSFVDRLHFIQYTEEDGLFNGYVTSIYQDSLGFMWFGTANGVSRFDGYNFEHFPSFVGDSSTLSHKNIWSIVGAPDGALWIATGGGLNRLDPSTRRIDRFYHDPASSVSLSNNSIWRIFLDHRGRLWTGTDNGLNVTGDNGQTFTRIAYDPADTRLVRSIWEDDRMRLWFAVKDTLYLLDEERFVHFPYRLPRPDWLEAGAPLNIRLLYQRGDSILWVGSDAGGLYGFDTHSMKYVHHFTADETRGTPALRSNQINALLEDRDGRLWIGTMDGLHILDRKTSRMMHYTPDATDPAAFNFKEIWSLYEDRAGNIWVGTFYGGVKVWLRNRKQFNNYRFDPADPLIRNGVMVQNFAVEPEGRVWVVVGRSLFAYLDFSSSSLTEVGHTIPSTRVSAFMIDQQGRQWIGTEDAGLWRRDLPTARFIPVVGKEDPCFPDIWVIVTASDGNIWSGNAAGVVCRFDAERNTHTVYRLDQTKSLALGLGNVPIVGIYESRDGRTWVSTYGGLNLFKPAEGSFTYFPSTTQVLSMMESDNGILWVGTGDGLYYFSKERKEIVRYTSPGFSLTEVVVGLQQDRNGLLWFSSGGYLVSYDALNDRMVRYGRNYDIYSPAFGSLMDQSGRLFFGGTDGFLWFDPADLPVNRDIPPVAITDIRINNNDVPIRGVEADTLRFPSPLLQDIRYTREIELAYWQNDVSFEFTALDYTAPARNRYRYKLEGYDEDWIEADAGRRFATYTNIPDGTYTFRVIAANNDGAWNEDGVSLSLSVSPPLWRSIYAYVFYVVLALGGIIAVDRFQRARLIARERAAARVREAELLAQAADERAHLAEQLDEAKTRLFVNLSHEFRTPLTLLLGPIRDAIDGAYGAINERLHSQLDSMYRSADRLHRLINQLLDLAKLEAGGMHLHTREGDLVAFVRALTLSFASRAERERKTLQFDAALPELSVFFDRDKIEKVVYNLLSNAFKFTPAHGKIRVTVDEHERAAQISVQDTGEGIPAAELPHIFNRFHQADTSTTRRHEGSGIGLALANELVELHGGVIEVDSSEGFGSTFTVTLPLGRAHIRDEDLIAEDDDEAPKPPFTTFPVSTEPTETLPTAEEPVGQPVPPTILIVEDNKDVRAYLKSHLGRYRIVEAEDGKEGLARALATQPDLVISDVMMPKMDGYALCAALKGNERTQDIPVILLTAKAAEENKIEGLEAGADDYLYKPFSARELLARTENLIAQRRQMKSKYRNEVVLKPADVTVSSADALFIEKIHAIVDANMGDSHFGAEMLAGEIGLSWRQLQRRMRALLHVTPTAFIRAMRLERASQLLEQRAGNVSEIAYQVGYRNPRHFSRQFKEKYGWSPSLHGEEGSNE